MLPALQNLLLPLTRRPEETRAGGGETRLNIAVIFTSERSTIAALKAAGAMADRLDARITIVAPQIVPYPAPLTSPPVRLDWNESRLLTLAAESPVETTVQIYLCRDSIEMLNTVLPPCSLVVIGGRRGWWPTREKSIARRLRRSGHEVVLTSTE